MKKEYINIIIYVVIAVTAFMLYKKLFSQSAKDKDYLLNLGFGIADRMSEDEIKTAASYIRDYRQKGIEPNHNTFFWQQVKAISSKYKIF
jgi:hypothetical protein